MMQWLKKHKLIVFIGSIVTVFVGSIVIRLITPKPPAPVQDNSWGPITPGYSTIQDVKNILGDPLNTSEVAEGKKLQYQSIYPTLPHEIVVDDSETVVFIKEHIDYTKAPKLTDFVARLGQYDLELNEPATGYSVKAYVFLQKGVVLVAHVADGSVEQKWNFTPTTKENFLRSWGKSLTTTIPEGEVFDSLPPLE